MGPPEENVNVLEEQANEEDIKSAKALVQSFLQTLKGYRLYESNHPILVKFLERLKKDFDKYFIEFPSFALQVGEHQLIYRGKAVYESQDVKESLAFLFFKDGIRELRFLSGLEFQEILDFLTVVRKSDSVNRMEDDLVTLLWEKDFAHISFVTIDEFLEKGGTFVPATEEDLLKGLEFRNPEADGQPEITQVREGEGAGVHTDEALRQALNPSPGQPLVDACQLTAEEAERVNQDINQEQHPDRLYALMESLIEILLHLGEDMDAYENLISYFERILQALLDQGDVKKTISILEMLKEPLESMVLKDKQIFALRRILESSVSPQAIKLLGKAMQRTGEADSDFIVQYLQLMNEKAILPLCILLGELESPKWRKAISDLLVQLAKGDIAPLVKFLSDRNSTLVCQILYILGKIGHPSTVRHLGPLVGHGDPRVREETLGLLTRFGDHGKDLIQRFLRDPVSQIRAKASHSLARAIKHQAVKPLTEIILSEEFLRRDYEEKVAFFRALAETESKEAIPILQEIANKRNWFRKAKWEEMRVCATNTLRMLEAVKRQEPNVRRPSLRP